MKLEELYLAMIEIYGHLGFVDGEAQVLEECASWRRVFHYGDVLTIQRMYQLHPRILKQLTHIEHCTNAEKLYRLQIV